MKKVSYFFFSENYEVGKVIGPIEYQYVYYLYLEIEEIKERDRREFQMEDKKGEAIDLVAVLEDTIFIKFFEAYLFLLHLSLLAI